MSTATTMSLDDCFAALTQLLPGAGRESGSNCRKEDSALAKRNTLKMATNMFRQINVFHHSTKSSEAPSNQLVNFQSPLDSSHLENLGGFFTVIAEDGTILYASENVNKYTPCSQGDLIGSPLIDFALPPDHRKIRHHLSRKKSGIPAKAAAAAVTARSGSDEATRTGEWGSNDVPTSSSALSYPSVGERQFFHFRFKMDADFNHVNVMGHYRQLGSSSVNPAERDYLFLGMIRPVKDRPITELSLVESIQDQYITRHLPDGKIMFADHRISTACGYLPSDVVGKSGFYFIHGDDLPWSAMANRQMFASSSGEGYSTYRLLCKDNKHIIVQTRGYLEFNQHTQKVESFMCINTVVKEAEGMRLLSEQKERFTPYVLQYQKMMLEEDRVKDTEMLSIMSKVTDSHNRSRMSSSTGGKRRNREEEREDPSCGMVVATGPSCPKALRLSTEEQGGENHYDQRQRELQYRVLEGNRVVDIYPEQHDQMRFSQVAVAASDDSSADYYSQIGRSVGDGDSVAKRNFENFLKLMDEPEQLGKPLFGHKTSSKAT